MQDIRGSFRPVSAFFSLFLISLALSAATEPATVELVWLDGTNGFRVPGPESFADCCQVRGVGDMNGDGLDDLAFAADEANGNGWGSAGAVYVLFGGLEPAASFDVGEIDGTNGFVVRGNAINHNLGNDIARGGDINGDGLDDLVIGTNTYGEAYVIFGARSFPAEIDPLLLDGIDGFALVGVDGPFYPSWLGEGVDGDFDLNGDGLADFLVRDQRSGSGGQEAFVIFGRPAFPPSILLTPTLDSDVGFAIYGTLQVGYGITAVRDFNGDGRDDIAVPARYEPEVRILFGADTYEPRINVDYLKPGQGVIVTGANGVADGGDVNADGIRDLLLAEAGTAYLVYGSRTFGPEIDLAAMGREQGFSVRGRDSDGFGSTIAGLGDFNGDGFDDIAIGADRFSAGPKRDDAGATYVVYGGNALPPEITPIDLDGTNGFSMLGISAGDNLGISGRGSDFNRDGRPDLLLYARDSAVNGPSSGEAYAVFEQFRPQPALEMIGSCPGEVTRELSFVTPNRAAGLYESPRLGESVIDEGPCAGTVLDLASASLRGLQFVDDIGTSSSSAELDLGLCSLYVQFVDAFTCETTAVMQVPNRSDRLRTGTGSH